jgi:hypothetical protein
MEAFVAALRNLAIGDRLSAALQFLAAEGFADEVVIAAVLVLVDPTFDAANATLKEIKGIANVLRRAVEADRELDVASLKDMRVRAAEEFTALEARRANRKAQLCTNIDEYLQDRDAWEVVLRSAYCVTARDLDCLTPYALAFGWRAAKQELQLVKDLHLVRG